MKPLIIAIAGIVSLGGGALAGAMFNTKPAQNMSVHDATPAPPAQPSRFEYVKFNSQFVVPVQAGGQVTALLVTNLQLEVAEGSSEDAFRREPRLRDAFLKILFQMAGEGAFDADMFAPATQTELRGRLLAAARNIMGPSVNAVLISDFLKQDR